MTSSSPARVVVTGLGMVGPLGCTIPAFTAALREGRIAIARHDAVPEVPGGLFARMPAIDPPRQLRDTGLSPDRIEHVLRSIRRAPEPVIASVLCALQAWQQAGLIGGDRDGGHDPEACSLIVAGQNLGDALAARIAARYQQPWHTVPASYALQVMDTDHVGTVSEALGIKGEGFCIGAASASGNAGLLQGARLVASGEYARCLIVGPMAALSPFTLHALLHAGAMSEDRPEIDATRICRPFDADRSGCVLGQAAAAILLESEDAAARRGAARLAELPGGAMTLDANRLSHPDPGGEARVMRRALARAGIDADAVDYVNAHGTGTPAGDDAEVAAIRTVFGRTLSRVAINATKALTGHGLWSAGLVEAIATIVQMRGGFLHGNPNLERPIDPDCRFVGRQAEPASVRVALSNAFGFGGIGSAIVLRLPSA